MKDLPDRFSYGRCFSIIYRHGKTINDRMIRNYSSGRAEQILAHFQKSVILQVAGAVLHDQQDRHDSRKP